LQVDESLNTGGLSVELELNDPGQSSTHRWNSHHSISINMNGNRTSTVNVFPQDDAEQRSKSAQRTSLSVLSCGAQPLIDGDVGSGLRTAHISSFSAVAQRNSAQMEQEFVSALRILYQFISTVDLSEFESRRCGKIGPDGDSTA
jgi:hypothetical protein